MRQDQKDGGAQVARRGRARGAGEDALAQGASAFARAGFADPSLVLRWAEIAGPDIARVTRPVRLQEDPSGAVLTLRCTPGAALLLQHETRALIARINGFLGARRIARLRFVTGLALPASAPPKHPSVARDQPDSEAPANLDEALERLAKRRR